MHLSFTTLDSFTATCYAGNPVSIISVPSTLSTSLTQEQKQAIAAEFNLSEIVFLHLPAEGSSWKEVKIDIFTALAEVPFAGHPTIGSAHYLLNILGEKTEAVITKAGKIPIQRDERTGEVRAVIPQNFHIHKVTYTSDLTPTPAPTTSIVNGMSFILVALPDLSALSLGTKNLQVLAHGSTYDPTPLDAGWQNGLIGTMYFVARGIDEFGRKKYRTRMIGSREDPGTGSASSALACWLALREPGEGNVKFAFEQGVEMGRRNEIAVEVTRNEGGKGIATVVLSGNAVKVMEGTLEV